MTPPPNLQKLVEKYGGYDRIPPEVWTKYDAALKRWQQAINAGDHWFGSGVTDGTRGAAFDP
jgi:hypothetical protein